ncbi:hypothetical protein Lal_00021054 [Lupinus albus]|nr:hypothetical protein Lal_00021054 [Lupinus albus]
MKDYREAEHVICFLKGVNENYNTIKAQILLMEPFPTLNKLYSLVTQQENQQDFGSIRSEKLDRQAWSGGNQANNGKNIGRGTMANTNSGPPNRSILGKAQAASGGFKICIFCGRENHTVDSCYYKHEFPPNFKFRTRSASGAVNATFSQDHTNQYESATDTNEDKSIKPTSSEEKSKYVERCRRKRSLRNVGQKQSNNV